jgi:putative phosphonate metabolism protein
MSEARFAIYFTPAPGSPLARFGAAALGYDGETGTDVPQLALPGIDPADAARAAVEPARYGFHGTLVAPFALAPQRQAEGLSRALGTFAARRAAFSLGRLKVARIGRFIALVPAGPQEGGAQLAADCLHAFDPFRAPLTQHDRARRLAARLTPRQIELLDRWGYPYVLSEFRFHMTLTGALPDNDRARFLPALADAFAPLSQDEVEFDAVSLVRQDDRASRFRVIERVALNG